MIVLVVRWIARLLALLVVTLVVVMAMGSQLDPAILSGAAWVQLALLAIACAGLLLGWKNELLGGTIGVGSLIAFYVVELAWSGRFPTGWGFPMMALPGFLFLLAWLIDGRWTETSSCSRF